MQFWTSERISKFEDIVYLWAVILMSSTMGWLAFQGHSWGMLGLMVGIFFFLPILRGIIPVYLVFWGSAPTWVNFLICSSVVLILWSRWLRVKNIPYNR
jgi:intracellular septation protein A